VIGIILLERILHKFTQLLILEFEEETHAMLYNHNKVIKYDYLQGF